MVSSTKIVIPEYGTQLEIDALTSVPLGCVIFNTTTGKRNVAIVSTPPAWATDDFLTNILTSVATLDASTLNFQGMDLDYTSEVVSSSFSPRNRMRVIADEAIAVGDVLTASPTTAFRVVKVKSFNPDATGVIGFATTSAAAAGDEILIDGANIVTVVADSLATIALGNPIEKSDTDDGRVQAAASSVGTFGVTAQSATPNAPFKVWLRVNESF